MRSIASAHPVRILFLMMIATNNLQSHSITSFGKTEDNNMSNATQLLHSIPIDPLTGAISVPLFTLFGLDGLRLRVDDCKPTLLITNAEKAESTATAIIAANDSVYVSSTPR